MGNEIRREQWPWLARLTCRVDLRETTFWPYFPRFADHGVDGCGGSLIRLSDDLAETDIIITGKHCLVDRDSRDINADESISSMELRAILGDVG